MSVVLQNRYILIYGGTNSEEKLLQQFYLYDIERQEWRKIEKVHGNVEAKVGGTLINIKNQIYLFGGQINDQNQYSNQIYKIQITNYRDNTNLQQPQIFIKKLNVFGSKPLPRSQFASLSYKDRYLIILGGQGQIKQKSQFPTLYNDIWVFDTQKLYWEEIIPENASIFKPRSSFTASVYKQSIIIFGGLIGFKDFRTTDQIFVLHLNTEIQKKPICNLCRSSFKLVPKQDIKIQKTCGRVNQNTFKTGFSTIYGISQTIEDPLIALGTLIHSFDGFQIQKCSIVLNRCNMSINIKNMKISRNQWQHILTSYEYVPLISESDLRVRMVLKEQTRRNKVIYLSYTLKNSCFRLGNELLLGWANDKKQLELCLMNKYGIYHTRSSSQKSLNQLMQGQIIFQFIKQNHINLQLFLNHSFTIFLTSFKNKPQLNFQNQLHFDLEVNDIVSHNKVKFKQFLRQFFCDSLSFQLAVSNTYIHFFNNSMFFSLNTLHNDQKCSYSNSYPDFFEDISTYQTSGNSMILIYQNRKLMHKKQLKKQKNVCYEFKLTSKVQPNITFTDVFPSESLLQAIKKVVEGITSSELQDLKRNKPLYRKENIDKHDKVTQPKKIIKTNENQPGGNQMEE